MSYGRPGSFSAVLIQVRVAGKGKMGMPRACRKQGQLPLFTQVVVLYYLQQTLKFDYQDHIILATPLKGVPIRNVETPKA
jgi:hypothetical protein